MKRVIILNPKSRNGAAQRIFESQRAKWEGLLGDFELQLTTHPGDATGRVAALLDAGTTDQILVAGGDGSINEACRGYWRHGALIDTQVPLGIINLGTGGDFHRTVRSASADYEQALAENRSRLIDAAEVRTDGGEARPFLNISSVGLGGDMLRSLKSSKFQAGAAAYFYHTIKTLARYRSQPVQVALTDGDNTDTHEINLLNFFVCNGRFSGGGMQWAPDAALDSGDLCVTVVEGPSKLPLVLHSRKVYAGRLDAFPGARTFRAREIRVTSPTGISLEADGEIVESPAGGGHEFRFRVIPRAFPLVL
jgi:diacylglycerol kinase family enzyme